MLLPRRHGPEGTDARVRTGRVAGAVRVQPVGERADPGRGGAAGRGGVHARSAQQLSLDP